MVAAGSPLLQWSPRAWPPRRWTVADKAPTPSSEFIRRLRRGYRPRRGNRADGTRTRLAFAFAAALQCPGQGRRARRRYSSAYLRRRLSGQAELRLGNIAVPDCEGAGRPSTGREK